MECTYHDILGDNFDNDIDDDMIMIHYDVFADCYFLT